MTAEEGGDLCSGEGAAFGCSDCRARVAVAAGRVETAAVRCVACDETMERVERR